jgi:hypothetical protein
MMRDRWKGFRSYHRIRIDAFVSKHTLESKEGRPFDFAISSQNIPMFDFDTPNLDDVLQAEKLIRIVIWESLPSYLRQELKDITNLKFALFKTKHGFHLIYGIRVPYTTWYQIYRAINVGCEKFPGLDCVHLKASIDRGMTTLRMDKDTVLIYTNTNEKKVIEKAIENLKQYYSVDKLMKLLPEEWRAYLERKEDKEKDRTAEG